MRTNNNIETLAALVGAFLNLKGLNPKDIETHPTSESNVRYAPMFGGSHLSPADRWYVLDRPGYEAGQVDISLGHFQAPLDAFLTYTVLPGLTYGRKIYFQDNELDLWGNHFRDCLDQNDIKAVMRRLLVEHGGYKRNDKLMESFDVPVFHKSYQSVLTLAWDMKYSQPDIEHVSDDMTRALSKQVDIRFDNFYQLLDKHKNVGTPEHRLLNQDDIAHYIPRLRDAYKAYLRGWIPGLIAFFEPEIKRMSIP